MSVKEKRLTISFERDMQAVAPAENALLRQQSVAELSSRVELLLAQVFCWVHRVGRILLEEWTDACVALGDKRASSARYQTMAWVSATASPASGMRLVR